MPWHAHCSLTPNREMVVMGMTANLSIQPAVFTGASDEVRSAVQLASAETGVSFSYLMAKAAVESGYRADVKAPTSSATGLYQFIERTWLSMVKENGAKYGLEDYAAKLEAGKVDGKTRREILELRKDPKLSALMAAEYARDNKEALQKSVGGEIGDTELYLAHFLGAGGAKRFLSAMRRNPNQIAAQVMPEAAHANRNVFYGKSGARTLAQVYDRFTEKLAESGAAAGVAPTSTEPAGRPAPYGLGTGAIASRGGFTPVVPGGSPAEFASRMFMARLSLPGEPGAIS
ncbi:hypothetical protein ABIE65_000661 [Constrictibacter sp. MBR-5]